MRRGRWTTGSALLLATTVLAACTGASGGGAAGSGGDVAAARVSSGGSAGGGGSAPTAAASAPSATSGGTDASARLAPELILTGSLSVVVGSVDRSAARAESIAAAAGGRTDADDQDNPAGSRPTAELTLRVPNATVPAVLNRLAALGRQTDRHLSTRDVTSQVADVNSRVTSARSAIASLRTLYRTASNVGDVIRIESTLSQREAALESLEARQRSLSRQVALATITLQLTQRRHHHAPAPAPKAGHRGGFVGGLDRGWHAFTATAVGLATALGTVLPFLLVIVVLGAIGLVVRRRALARPRPSAVPGDE